MRLWRSVGSDTWLCLHCDFLRSKQFFLTREKHWNSVEFWIQFVADPAIVLEEANTGICGRWGYMRPHSGAFLVVGRFMFPAVQPSSGSLISKISKVRSRFVLYIGDEGWLMKNLSEWRRAGCLTRFTRLVAKSPPWRFNAIAALSFFSSKSENVSISTSFELLVSCCVVSHTRVVL